MMWHDIEMNSIIFVGDSHSHRTHERIESWIQVKTQSKVEIQMKCKFKTGFNKIINFVYLITFQVLVGFS